MKASIELVDRIPARKFANDDDFSNWVTNYYKQPEPESAIAACLYYINSPIAKKETTVYPFSGFFTAVFRDNLYLIDEVANKYPGLSSFERRFLIVFFNSLKEKKADDFLDTLGEPDKGFIAELRKMPNSFITNPVTNPSQLDYLWGSFFGSGRYEHILAPAVKESLGKILSSP